MRSEEMKIPNDGVYGKGNPSVMPGYILNSNNSFFAVAVAVAVAA